MYSRCCERPRRGFIAWQEFLRCDLAGDHHGVECRVAAPNQIGFCKSSKPAHYQYSFWQLVGNTHELLAPMGITHATVIDSLPGSGGAERVRHAQMIARLIIREKGSSHVL